MILFTPSLFTYFYYMYDHTSPTGDYGDSNGPCNALDSLPISAALCLGTHACNVQTSNNVFGDPCYGE